MTTREERERRALEAKERKGENERAAVLRMLPLPRQAGSPRTTEVVGLATFSWGQHPTLCSGQREVYFDKHFPVGSKSEVVYHVRFNVLSRG